jgi:hypothetical protein
MTVMFSSGFTSPHNTSKLGQCLGKEINILVIPANLKFEQRQVSVVKLHPPTQGVSSSSQRSEHDQAPR